MSQLEIKRKNRTDRSYLSLSLAIVTTVVLLLAQGSFWAYYDFMSLVYVFSMGLLVLFGLDDGSKLYRFKRGAYYGGTISFLSGMIVWFGSSLDFSKAGPAIAVCLMGPFYALLISLVCCFIEKDL